MGFIFKGFGSSGTFAHGVHPPERKGFSDGAPIEVIPPPKKVMLPLLQHVGAPAKPAVKPKTDVVLGDKIAEPGGFVSTAHHATISGKVMKTGIVTLTNGRHVPAIPIKAGNEEQLSGQALWEDIFGGEWPRDVDNYSSKEIVDAISAAGIVGLGGAAFPTHVKFVPNEKKPVHTVLVNACECEPYLTADYRMMLEASAPIITGALLAGRAANTKNIIIGIEDNKPKAVEVMKKAAAGTGITIAVLKTKYPQGSEKQLIMAVTGKEVPLGGLPLDVGIAVSNVSTVAAIARAVVRKKPLTHRVVTVTGAGIKNPKNLLVPIGISIGELIEYCGGLTKDAARLISGGPMMGFAFANLDAPVTKGTSGITVLTHKDVQKEDETNCVRCGRCVDVCPMNLVPTKLALASRHKDIELAERYNIMACFECGSCAYACPASLPIVQLVRTGKAVVIAASKK
ncbi:Ion-translocating oxidoreductase complex, subunit C [Desulfonema limicola]|uniref:Ion-translocating oxidoreductase complex subunit C n=1 Tax=Desulfonema limicola TaxID=45656 RepID=A0A975B6B7_9BACT|nr:electron transport complex subunit RsxC [Desulfonema limicola]QTA79608.1 Ion-translocating oxidoreductase complex, subunit C [Desulfonema limicola]